MDYLIWTDKLLCALILSAYHFPEIKAKSVKFVVKKASEGVQEVGLSEIYVMGKTLDEK
jgi:hypothetical protein